MSLLGSPITWTSRNNNEIFSEFGYCQLIWMFHGRSFNNKISYMQKRALRIIYANKTSAFQQLLEQDN